MAGQCRFNGVRAGVAQRAGPSPSLAGPQRTRRRSAARCSLCSYCSMACGERAPPSHVSDCQKGVDGGMRVAGSNRAASPCW